MHVLIQVVPLLVMFLTKFLSFYRKERKVLRKVRQSFFCYLVNASNQQGTRENAGIYRQYLNSYICIS
ncbi:hypothetical protein BVG80_03845 [Sphingobacteriales bacterium TSM_CSM]|nr:hypothetical protein BVG80_03845 [Sphingobacteriales bacterium TSM_CSM]